MDDLASLVARRSDVLAALSEPRAKPEIVEATDRARSTVDRAIAELEDAGLVRRNGSTYRTNTTGELLLEERESYLDTLSVYAESREFVDGVRPADPLSPELLREAEISAGTPNMPEKGVKRNIEIVKEATRIRGTVPRMYDIYNTLYARRILEEGMEVVAIYDRETLDVATDEYADVFDQLAESGNVTAYVADEIPSYGISVLDTPAGEVVQGEVSRIDGPRVGLTNYDDDAVQWVEDLLASIEDDAERILP